MEARNLRVGLIGYGEVGKILGRALIERRVAFVGAWDRLLREPSAAAAAMRAHAEGVGVATHPSVAALCERADLLISAVTASQTLAVASEVAGSIRPNTWFLDLNSASPGTKQTSSGCIDGAGGRYVEAAVMASIAPYALKVPMLLGGAHAAALGDLLTPLGFALQIASPEIGVASAIKMSRSVFMKGLEAIVVESLTTARHYGVEDRVLASLQESYPTVDWDAQASYLFSRVALHGKRRAEEMREAALTVKEAGLVPHLASATAQRQDAVAQIKERAALSAVPKDANWRSYADRILLSVSPAADASQHPRERNEEASDLEGLQRQP